MKKIYLSFLFAFVLIQAQGQNAYQNSYPSGLIAMPQSVTHTQQNGVVFQDGFGGNVLTHLDSAGNVIWSRNYYGGLDVGGSMVTDSVALYSIRNSQLTKIDLATGAIIWQNTYTDASNVSDLVDINLTSTGELAITGSVLNFVGDDEKVLLFTTDTSGSVMLAYSYDLGAADDEGTGVEGTSDKGFIIQGYYGQNGGSNNGFIMKLDSFGSVEWVNEIQGASSIFMKKTIAETPSGYLFHGHDSTGNAGDFILNTASNGSLQWSRKFEGNEISTYEDGAGGIYWNMKHLVLGRLDDTGQELWQKTYAGTSTEMYHIVKSGSNQLSLVGSLLGGGAAIQTKAFQCDAEGHGFCFTNPSNEAILDTSYSMASVSTTPVFRTLPTNIVASNDSSISPKANQDCQSCWVEAEISTSAAIVCTGDTIELFNTSFGSVGQEWYEDGIAVTTAGILIVTKTVADTIQIMMIVNDTSCQDTAYLEIIFQDFQFSISGNPIMCGGPDTTTLVINGGNFFNWTPTTNISCTNCETVDVYPPVTTLYKVEVSDTNGCSGVDSILIEIVPFPTPNLGPDTSFCGSAGSGLVTLDPGNFASYLWHPNMDTTATVNPSGPGTYSVDVTDSNGCMASDSVEIVFFPAIPPIYLGNDTTICGGDTLVLDAGSGFAVYSWAPNGEITPTIDAINPGTYSIIATDTNGCVGIDTLIMNTSGPGSFLRSDTTLCDGDSLVLDAGTYASYMWTPGGSTNQMLTVFTTNNYIAQVQDTFGCFGWDTVMVTFQTVNVSLGSDTTICSGDSILLDAGSFSSYSWTPGAASTQTIYISSAGQVSVDVTDGLGCMGSDTVNIGFHVALPSINLGVDTTLCGGDTLILDAGIGFANYLWAPNGETTQTINAINPATYSVTGSDVNGCSVTDDLIVTTSGPGNFLRTDTTLCEGDSITLDAGTYSSYLWTPGSSTNQMLTVFTTNNYIAQVQDTAGCFGWDTVLVSFQIPNVNLGVDTAFCPGDSVQLDAGTFSSYSWTPGGAITQTIYVSSVGAVSLEVTDALGCMNSDTVNVTNGTVPMPNLGADTTICNGANHILNPGSFVTYSWMPGASSGPTLTVTSANTYSVDVTNADGCHGYDTVAIQTVPGPVPSLGSDTAICPGDTLTLDAGSGGSFSWSPSGDTTQTIKVTGPGNYSVTVDNGTGCVGSDAITITPNLTVSFTVSTNMATATFTSSVAGGMPGYAYAWDFGDGNNSSMADPMHTYLKDSLYTACLTVTDTAGCMIQFCDTVNVIIDRIDQGLNSTTFEVYPVPSKEYLMISGNFTPNKIQQVSLYDLTGRLIKSWNQLQLSGKEIRIELPNVTDGNYILDVKSATWQGRKLIRIE